MPSRFTSQGLTKTAAALLASMSEEVINVVKAISKARPDVTFSHVETFENWFLRTYKHTIGDGSSLYSAMRTNSAYDGENCRFMKYLQMLLPANQRKR